MVHFWKAEVCFKGQESSNSIAAPWQRCYTGTMVSPNKYRIYWLKKILHSKENQITLHNYVFECIENIILHHLAF